MQAQIHEGGDVWFACVIQLCSQEINRLKKKSKLRQRGKARKGSEIGELGQSLRHAFFSSAHSGL